MTNKTVDKSNFYSNLALKKGGRPAAIGALDELISDLEVLIATNIEAIKRIHSQIKKAENNTFPIPKSKLETTFITNQMHDELAFLKKLDKVCRYNLHACMLRKKELKA